jgi:hypothetical protein
MQQRRDGNPGAQFFPMCQSNVFNQGLLDCEYLVLSPKEGTSSAARCLCIHELTCSVRRKTTFPPEKYPPCEH